MSSESSTPTPTTERTCPFAHLADEGTAAPHALPQLSRFSADSSMYTASTMSDDYGANAQSRFSEDTPVPSIRTAHLSYSGHSEAHASDHSDGTAATMKTDWSATTPISPTQTAVEDHTYLYDAPPPPKTCPVVFMQEIDAHLLRTSLEDRVAYLTDFLGFTSNDADIITKVAPLVNDIIPGMVDGMYAKLFEFDVTKRVFMSRNQGFDGPLPESLEDLTLDSAQITFRKVFMKSWARRVLTADYSSGKTFAYMDKVGIMHTGVSPFKHQRTMGIAPLNVPYRDCALMLGWITQVLQSAILSVSEAQLPLHEKVEACAAINKVIWIQNDLFARHYINE